MLILPCFVFLCFGECGEARVGWLSCVLFRSSINIHLWLVMVNPRINCTN